MKTTGLAVLLLATSAFAGGINWESDYERAKERAVLEGKLLFLDFYSDT